MQYQILTWIQSAVAWVPAAVAVAALYKYWRNVATRRAEWLLTLYQKFFEDERYKRMRRALDYESDPLHAQLMSCTSANGQDNPDLEEHLVDYLNFFEFVANLWLSGQLDLKEVDNLFNYYLHNLAVTNGPWIRPYLATEGFESLLKLFDKMKRDGRFRSPL